MIAVDAGVFGVKVFLLAGGTLLLNEIARGPHNSGHYTTEACATSQYEQHLRAILGILLSLHCRVCRSHVNCVMWWPQAIVKPLPIYNLITLAHKRGNEPTQMVSGTIRARTR